MKLNRYHLLLLLLWIFCACSSGKKTPPAESSGNTQKLPSQPATDYTPLIPSIVHLESFDGERFLNSETAFFVDSNLLACRLNPLQNASRARISPWNEDRNFTVAGFVAVDRINGLVLLQAEGIKRKPVHLYTTPVQAGTKCLYLTRPRGNTLPLHRGMLSGPATLKGSLRYLLTNRFRSQSYGTPVFTTPDRCIGLGYAEPVDYEQQHQAIPASLISELLSRKTSRPEPLQNLGSRTSKAISETNSKISGLEIVTDMGTIRIRLFNQTPQYRDNFIALVREQYYDSLLIHRVIRDFGIQSGAADTRYAGKDDVVGWKGPGYTLPAHPVPGLFHRRGMIGSPRKPDRANSKRRSDGSQFYIVTGRRYTDAELDEIEQENQYRFSAKQRQIYKSEGGAPHLDGSYTVFGEVLSGMETADRISRIKVDSDFRPLQDIRIRHIRILP
ncbi:MAG: peptidylprolyl isomerase [Mangrovibacterium sp.]